VKNERNQIKNEWKNDSLSSLLSQCCPLPLPERKEFEVDNKIKNPKKKKKIHTIKIG
jgi:hypothetical protein